MTKFKQYYRHLYIIGILFLFYLPLLFMIIFSFNKTSEKGYINFGSWNGLSFDAYNNLFKHDFWSSLFNSFLVAFVVSIFVVIFSLSAVYSIWKLKNKSIKTMKNIATNISIILPDIIIAIALVSFFGIFFGSLKSNQEGFINVVIGHIVMALPYGILIMYPKSEKFNQSLFEASWDLGYSKIRTWFKTYFVYMLSSINFTILITFILSFDDFIITLITSNIKTIGTDLYQGNFKSWSLALGSFLIIIITSGNFIYLFKNLRKEKRRSVNV